MRATPDGWPRISASLFYDDPKRAIDWLCNAFGFELRLLVETGDGGVAHSELVFGEGVVMVSAASKHADARSPMHGGGTQGLMVYVDDIAAHCERARKNGARVFQELSVSDYGEEFWSDRHYGAFDCEGHRWWFSERIATGNPTWSKVRNRRERHAHE